MRVIFAGGGTGGHLYPGLAIARALVRLRGDVQPFFVGARRGVERDVLPTTEFPYELLDLHPLYRQRFWNNWKTLAGAARAWRRLSHLVAQDRPAAVVGTGGYASGLALAYAATHAIPYVLQEQNSHPGLTMRLFARRAREVYLGFPEAARLLKSGEHTRIIDAGNPIEPPPSPRPDRAEARGRWALPRAEGRVLLVFGGSQGAKAINDAVAAWIRAGSVPHDLSILWATGKGTYDAYAELAGDRIRIHPYIAPMRDAYAASDLALARAGAMGTAEMCAWGIPQILVPLPTAAADHQTANARALEAAGAAIVLPQSELGAERLDRSVRGLLENDAALARLSDGAAARARPDAAENIAKHILTLIDLQQHRS